MRLGDPETQVVLPLIDEPLLPLLMAAARADLQQSTCRVGPDGWSASCSPRGAIRSRPSRASRSAVSRRRSIPGVAVFHAGTAIRDGQLVTAGGRVLTVVGRGPTFAEAIERAYAGVAQI